MRSLHQSLILEREIVMGIKSIQEVLDDSGQKVYRKVALSFEPVEKKECEQHGAYNYRFSNGDYLQDRFQEDCPKCVRAKQVAARLGGRDGVSRRFQTCSFEGFKVSNKQQSDIKGALQDFSKHFDKHLEMGTPVLLLGGVGTGKTHLACSIANEIAKRGHDSIFRSVSQLVRSVRDTWRISGAESKQLEIYHTVDLLIIDEVGVQAGSENERNILFDIINGRYEEMKPTIMISNLTMEKFTEAVGQRIASRIQHNGLLLPFTWSDYRAA